MELAELVLRTVLLTSSAKSLPGKVIHRGSRIARSSLVRLRDDPLIRHRVGAFEIMLPLSHELPIHLRNHPLYLTNIGRIAHAVGGPVVDIGANVGDTAAIIRSACQAPILCIEGDDHYAQILRRNVRVLDEPQPEVEQAFLGGTGRARIERSYGTARLVAGEEKVTTRTLAEILARHPLFGTPTLVKIDTDGMDVAIILSELDLLGRLQPVLFFEYDPYLGADPVVFERLREIGYKRAHVYENTGEFRRTIELPGDVHDEYNGHGGVRYADICAFTSGLDRMEP